MKIFPGAEGWGAGSVGGRGGQVIEVTNLDDSGPGSLRACVEGSEFPRDYTGPTNRICVFRIAGVIELNGPLRIKVPYITIAGQTAPGDGITLKGGGFLISTHDVIIRYLHYRGGSASMITVRSWNDAHDIIVDHCSASGGRDDIIDLFYNDEMHTDPDIRDITIQNCLIAEADAGHPTGFITGGLFDLTANPPILDDSRIHHISAHHNYFAANGSRNPLVKSQHTEVINNVVYNWNTRIGGTGNFAESDWINNYWKPGPMSENALVFEWLDGAKREFPLSSNYIAGNIIPTTPSKYWIAKKFQPSFGLEDPNQDNWFLFMTNHKEHGDYGNPVPEENRRFTPLTPADIPVTIKPAVDIFNSVVMNAGSNKRLNSDGTFTDNRDEVDQMFIDDFFNSTGPARPPSRATIPSSIDPGTPYADTDKDGMADEWEDLHGMNPNDPSDGPRDADGDGYTNLEEFLNGTMPTPAEVDGPPDNTGPVTSGVAGTPNPTEGATTVTLTATIDDSTTGGSTITAAEFFIDVVGADGTGIPMNPTDGTLDSPTEGVTVSGDPGLPPGDYTLFVHGRDSAGNWGGTDSVALEVTN